MNHREDSDDVLIAEIAIDHAVWSDDKLTMVSIVVLWNRSSDFGISGQPPTFTADTSNHGGSSGARILCDIPVYF
jgi:hypothetical protein